MNVFWNSDKNHYFSSKCFVSYQSDVKITPDRLLASALRADFRIEKKKISRIRQHSQAFFNGLRVLYYAPPFVLNCLTGLTCLLLVASITLLQKLPYDYYFHNTPRIIILSDAVDIDQVQQLKNKIITHFTVKTLRHTPPQEGFKRFIADLDHEDSTLKKLCHTMLLKSDNLPHVFEVIPHVHYLASPQLTDFFRKLNHNKGIAHIQLDKNSFQSAHQQYINQKKRVSRLIGLFL